MICAIISDSGQYFAEGSPSEIRMRITRNEEIDCWWYESHGVKQKETFWFSEDSVKLIRTECEASAIEAL